MLAPASRVAGSVALLIGSEVVQTVHPWMASLSMGAVVADSSLILRGRGVRLDVIILPEATTFTGSVNFVARQIEFRGFLTAREIIFTTNVIRPDRSADDADKTTLELNAVAGDITTFAILDDGRRGAGNAVLSRDFAITILILRRNSAFGDLDSLPFRFNPHPSKGQPVTALTTLTLTSNTGAQTVQDWMLPEANTNRDLSITSTGSAVIVNENINIGTGDLTLNGMGGIVLGSAITLTGGDIALTGVIDESGNGGNDALTVRVQGDITLNSDINLGTSKLDLQASGRITNGGTPPVITVGSLRLMQGEVFDADLLDPASRVAGAVALLIDRVVIQTVHPWMASLSTGAVGADSSLILRGRGVRLDVIVLPEAATFTGSVNFVARQVELRGVLIGREIIFTTNVLRPDRSVGATDKTTLELKAVAGDITTFAILDNGRRGPGNPVLSRDFAITTLILQQNSALVIWMASRSGLTPIRPKGSRSRH